MRLCNRWWQQWGGAAVIAIALFVPVIVRATENPFVNAKNQLGTAAANAGAGRSTDEFALEDIVGSLIKGALSILGVVFFGYMVWAGYLWMTAHGESSKIEKAKEMLKNATIGLGITLAAYAITQFVIGKLLETGAVAG